VAAELMIGDCRLPIADCRLTDADWRMRIDGLAIDGRIDNPLIRRTTLINRQSGIRQSAIGKRQFPNGLFHQDK
jgi:hypothetical protein